MALPSSPRRAAFIGFTNFHHKAAPTVVDKTPAGGFRTAQRFGILSGRDRSCGFVCFDGRTPASAVYRAGSQPGVGG